MSKQGLIFMLGFWCDPGKVSQIPVHANRADHPYHVRRLRAGGILFGFWPLSLGERVRKRAHSKHRDKDADDAKN